MRKVIAELDLVLRNFSCTRIRLMALLVLAAIAVVDLVSGNEISVSIFFLVPIAIMTWYCGHRAGIWFSFLSAILWFTIDYSERAYINPVAPYWNALVRLGFFLITEGLLDQLKIHLGAEQQLARTDVLTGLLNVRGFNEQAQSLFGLAARYRRPIALAYIDLDNFKKVNDELGHGEGDRVLRVIGGRISSSLRGTDAAGRLGGDEFAILLPETDEAGARAALEILRGALLQEAKQHGWPVSFSVGVVTFDSPPADFGEALRTADALMYQVKASGKDNILFLHQGASA